MITERKCKHCGNLAVDLWARRRVLEGLPCEESPQCKEAAKVAAKVEAAEAKAREAAFRAKQAEAKARKKAQHEANRAARADFNRKACGSPAVLAQTKGRGW